MQSYDGTSQPRITCTKVETMNQHKTTEKELRWDMRIKFWGKSRIGARPDSDPKSIRMKNTR